VKLSNLSENDYKIRRGTSIIVPAGVSTNSMETNKT